MYGRFYRLAAFPFYEGLIRRRDTLRYLKEMAGSQWLPAEIIAEIQWNRLKKLLEHAWENVPYYHQLMERLGLPPSEIKCWEDFQKLPTLSKETMRENYQDLVARNYRGRVLRKSTGGSTGEPLDFAYTRQSYERRIAAAIRGYSWAGCLDGEKTFYLWGTPIGSEPLWGRLKKSIHNAFLRRKMFNSFVFTDAKMEECIKQIQRFRPRIIVGFTSALYNLAEFIKRHSVKIPSPQAVITAAEGLFDYQRHLLEQTFQCRVFETYGSREFMMIASQCERHNGLHLNSDNLYVEFLRNGKPINEEEVGEIIITDLHNYGMPFIRYQIGDLGVPTSRRCQCGRGLPMMDRLEGRVLDTIQTPDGRLVPGIFFPRLMRQIPGVKKFRVLQEDIRSLKITLATAPNFSQTAQDFLNRETRKIFGEQVKLDFEFVPDIPPTLSGKLRVVTSKVPINFNS